MRPAGYGLLLAGLLVVVAAAAYTVFLGGSGGADGPLLYANERYTRLGGDDALVEGIVVQSSPECLHVNEGGGLAAVVWPHGASWDRTSREVVAPDGSSRIALGQRFAAGGGYYSDEGKLENVVGAAQMPALRLCIEEARNPEVAVLGSSITVQPD